MTKTMIVGLLLGVSLASPVMAAESACLQGNRVWGWQALDDKTLVVTDRNYKRYTVKLTGGCIGLDKYASAPLEIRTRTSLGCVGQGDRVAFQAPGLGPLSCTVTEVTDAPAAAPAAGH
ncbi:MAG TPA: DUF6491 family protein [Micropepsaceae bacterium]|nr:DUF6491 family protein [Micropepsaceae bacterium]